MASRMAPPGSIAEYINSAPKSARPRLRAMRAAIRRSAPGAVEGLKWGMPAFSHQRILVTFAAFTHHIGFYPTPPVVKAFAAELADYVTAKGSVQFPFDRPLPVALIRRMTAFRVRECVAADGKWRSG